MQFLEEEILEITEATWQSMLGLDIRPSPQSQPPTSFEGFLSGQVEITGAWNGKVLLHGSERLARSAAAVIFGGEPGSVTEQDQFDAIYELSNIIAGNIKSLLPEPCQLSLPTVGRSAESSIHIEGAERVSELMFDCQGQPMFVTVWHHQDSRI